MDLTNPALYSRTVTTSDTVDLADGKCRAIKVDGAGDIKVGYDNGLTDIFTLAAGEYLTVRALRIYATDTTITAPIHVLY